MSTTPGPRKDSDENPQSAEAPEEDGSAQPTASGRAMTQRQRAESAREAKLEAIREQVENGSLLIRQMSDHERRRNPPRSEPPKRSKRW